MQTPTPTSVVVSGPGTTAELAEAGRSVARTFSPRQLEGNGQVLIGNRLWIWFDLGVADLSPFGLKLLTTGGAEVTRNHLWVFSAVVEGHQVTLSFGIGHAGSDGPTDWDAEARRAGPTFRSILQRITFRRTQ